MKRTTQALSALLLLTGWMVLPKASAQVTNVVFTGDFSSLNTNQFIVGTRTLEGGTGTIVPYVSNGVCEITGTTTEQWWAGGSLQIRQVFQANPETNVVVSVDRVAENAPSTDTAHRSALWIMDPTLNYFVLFAEDVKETDWEYNRKIGASGDVPTGGGTAIGTFDTAPYNDLGDHTMMAVMDGTHASLYLDGLFGVSVPFPFNSMVLAIGSLARANNDVADTTFSNLVVKTVGFEAFSPNKETVVMGHSTSNVVVRIPLGANMNQAVHVTVTSDAPGVAIPAGAVGGALTLTFPAGGTNQQTIGIQSVAVGGAIFSLSNDINMGSANTLQVAVVLGPGVRLTDTFSGTTLNASNWQVDTNGFEPTGIGTFQAAVSNNTLVLSGTTDTQNYWPGIAVETVNYFTATPDLPLAIDVDRVGINPISDFTTMPDTGARTGVYITDAGRSPTNAANHYVFFGQDVGETGWEVNVNPGSATGSGASISQFSGLNDTNSHHIRMVADGSRVELFLDGQSGGKYPFPVTAGVYCELGAYARAVPDSVVGAFANLQIANILPPIAVLPATIETQADVNTNVVMITVPGLRTTNIAVTITSQDPAVAVPQGASGGALTLQFPSGATNVQTFNVVAVGPGQTSFAITNNQGVAVANGVALTVTKHLGVWFSDSFTNNVINTNAWFLDSTPLVPTGMLASDSSVFITNNQVEMVVHSQDLADWPGYALLMTTSYTASLLSPITFELDRVKMTDVLVGGTGTKDWTGIWVKDATTNYVFFGDYNTHDGTAGGWSYCDVIGATNSTGASTDTPLPTTVNVLSTLGAASLNDLGNHHMKVEANGSVVEMFLDGIYGGSAPFPVTNGITFGFGSYVNIAANNLGDRVDGNFANVVASGPTAVVAQSKLTITKQANGQLVINWTGTGTLQSSSAVTGGWSAVTPAPTGNSYTVSPAGNKAQFFRILQ